MHFNNRHMAIHGSEVADEFGFSREDQDKWALNSRDESRKRYGRTANSTTRFSRSLSRKGKK